MSQTQKQNTIREIQESLSYHGVEAYLQLLSEALGIQAEESQVYEDKNTGARYEIRKMQLDAVINEPVTKEELRQYREEERADDVRSEQSRIVAGLDSVRPGQVWRDNDSRFARTVEVMAVVGDKATIRNAETGKTTVASLKRFNGKTRGYSLVGGV